MFQRCLLTLALSLVTSICIGSQSSTHRIVAYDVDTDENLPIVLQGDVLQFQGALPRQGRATHMELRNGSRVLDAGDFHDEWRLRFDTEASDREDYILTVYSGASSSLHNILRRIPVTVATATPFAWDLPQRQVPGQTPRIAQLRITASTQLKRIRTEVTVDDQPIHSTEDGSGVISLAPDANQLGVHELGGRVIIEGGQEYSLPSFVAYVVGKIDLIGFPFGKKLDLTMYNGNLSVGAVIATDLQPARVTYRLDGAAIAEVTSPPFDSVVWNPVDVRLGSHTLTVEAADASGTIYRSQVYRFTVRRSEKKIPATDSVTVQLVGADADLPVAEGVSIATSDPNTLLSPITLRLQPESNFQADSVVYSVNGRTLPVNPNDGLTAYWDVRSEWPGDYSISAVATSVDGRRYRVPSATVHVLPRVTLTGPTETVRIDENHHTMTVRVQGVEGVHPQRVIYQVDGFEVGRKTVAPFETATLDLSNIESGTHIVTAWVVNDDSAHYVTPNVSIEIRNPALDADRARKLKEMLRKRH